MPVFPEGSAGSTGLLAVRVWGELNPALPGLGAQVHPENWEQGEKSSLASPGVAWEHDLETRPEFKDSQETMALKTIFFLINLFLYFWLRLVFVTARRLSLVAASGGYSSLRCVGISLRWPSVVVAYGL